MSTEKFRRGVLAFSFVLCGLMLIDSRFVPVSTKQKVITSKQVFIQHRRGSALHTYEINISGRKYDVPEDVYDEIGPGDTVFIQSSEVSGAPQNIALNENGNYYLHSICYISTGFGFIYLILVFAGSLITCIFYRFIQYEYGRRNLTYFALICVLVLLFFYLRT